MACKSCQERREAIARTAKKLGVIVFGGRRRKLADFAERGEKQPTAQREGPANGDARA